MDGRDALGEGEGTWLARGVAEIFQVPLRRRNCWISYCCIKTMRNLIAPSRKNAWILHETSTKYISFWRIIAKSIYFFAQRSKSHFPDCIATVVPLTIKIGPWDLTINISHPHRPTLQVQEKWVVWHLQTSSTKAKLQFFPAAPCRTTEPTENFWMTQTHQSPSPVQICPEVMFYSLSKASSLRRVSKTRSGRKKRVLEPPPSSRRSRRIVQT